MQLPEKYKENFDVSSQVLLLLSLPTLTFQHYITCLWTPCRIIRSRDETWAAEISVTTDEIGRVQDIRRQRVSVFWVQFLRKSYKQLALAAQCYNNQVDLISYTLNWVIAEPIVNWRIRFRDIKTNAHVGSVTSSVSFKCYQSISLVPGSIPWNNQMPNAYICRASWSEIEQLILFMMRSTREIIPQNTKRSRSH
jgi:hypothetical protein